MQRTGAFAVLFVVGMLVFFVGGYWAGISHGVRTATKIALPCLLLLATVACGRTESLRHWRAVWLAFFAASCAFLVAWWVSDPLMKLFGFTTDSVPGVALMKLFDALPIVGTVLLVARLGGLRPADLYLQKGRVKAWLAVGVAAFAAFAVLFLLQARDQGIAADRLVAYAPWILLFVLANGFMEELHFRGLLLQPLARLLGRHGANQCIALFFTLAHAPVQYTPNIFWFLAVLLVLALAWGYVIQKTQSLWGSVLFHAGADLLIIVGIWSQLTDDRAVTKAPRQRAHRRTDRLDHQADDRAGRQGGGLGAMRAGMKGWGFGRAAARPRGAAANAPDEVSRRVRAAQPVPLLATRFAFDRDQDFVAAQKRRHDG